MSSQPVENRLSNLYPIVRRPGCLRRNTQHERPVLLHCGPQVQAGHQFGGMIEPGLRPPAVVLEDMR
nr:hypothetical protein [Microvirga tunisiensis]